MLYSRGDMELDLPDNYQQAILSSIKSAGKLWGTGERSRLIVNPIKAQAATLQLKANMFADDKYEIYDFNYSTPIGGNGYL